MGLFRSKKPRPRYWCRIWTDADIHRLRIQTADMGLIEAAREFGRVLSNTDNEHCLYVCYTYNLLEVRDYLANLLPTVVTEPQKKRRVAVSHLGGHHLLLTCDMEIADKAKKFGSMYRDVGTDRYSLFVDHRYDVQEVTNYLESFND